MGEPYVYADNNGRLACCRDKKDTELYLALAGLLVAAAVIAWDFASIWVAVTAAAFVAFYFLTRKITTFKKEPEYPTYKDKDADEYGL